METLGGDLNQMRRTPLAPEHVAALRAIGREARYAAGEMITRPGDPVDQFIYVERGEIELLDPYTGERQFVHTLGPNQFAGEISFLTGGTWTLPLRAVVDTEVIAAPRRAVLDLMSRTPEMSDIIISVFAARRRRQIAEGDSSLILIGEEADRAVRRIAEFASRNRIPFTSHPLDSEAATAAAAASGEVAPGTPAVIFSRDTVLSEPTPAKLAQLLGLDLKFDERTEVDVLIVGGGPAGVAAAVYAASEGLCALVVEDMAVGGQAGTSSRIENYMGFPTGISGADLVWRGEVQAMKFGARFVMPRRVERLEPLEDVGFCAVFEDGQSVKAHAVVVASGVQYRRMPLDDLERFEGAGVYYAATEMEARYCAGTEAVVIGGGNSAGQAAMHLSRWASCVRVLVRGNSLAASMSHYLTDRLEADPAITVEYGAEVAALHGGDHLEAITIRDRATGRTRRVDTRALFVMVGAAPNTGWLSGLVDLDDKGFVKTGGAAGASSPFATSRPGVFAVGDVRAGSVKRVASAVGEGSVVISKVWDYLNAVNDAGGP